MTAAGPKRLTIPGRDPVIGELVASGVIRRREPAIGKVCVHFPRAGFVVAPA